MFEPGLAITPSRTTAPTDVRSSERDPDAALISVLERPPGPDIGNHERIERIGAYERCIAWLQTLQAREMAAFVQTAEDAMAATIAAHDRTTDGRLGVFDTVADAATSATAEIRMMLTLTGASTAARLARARRLHDPELAPTAALVRTGSLTWPKITLLIDGIGDLSPTDAERLQATVLPTAPGKTTGQLAAAINRFLTGLTDPDLPAKRRERKARTRGVVVQPEPDGMATLRVFLPAAAATGIYAVVDQHARRCPGTDPRGMDQRRADALVDLILRDTGQASEGTAAAAPGATPPDTTAVRADTERIPGVAQAPPGGSPFVRGQVSVRINVTVPLDSLIGVSEEPAELAGYGTIPAADARALAFDPDSVWTRLLTDPATGTVVHRDTTRYRPPDSTAEFVRARHGTCGAPGCRTPAHRCDLDHVVPHDPTSGTGPTCASNLCPFCRPHHRLKHMAGWHVELHQDGRTEWTTPSGHRYIAEPSPVGPVRSTAAPARTGPGVLSLMTDPAALARLADDTAEAPF